MAKTLIGDREFPAFASGAKLTPNPKGLFIINVSETVTAGGATTSLTSTLLSTLRIPFNAFLIRFHGYAAFFAGGTPPGLPVLTTFNLNLSVNNFSPPSIVLGGNAAFSNFIGMQQGDNGESVERNFEEGEVLFSANATTGNLVGTGYRAGIALNDTIFFKCYLTFKQA